MSDPGDLTEVQWEAVAPVIPEPRRRIDGRGRPSRGRREVLNGILYILRTGSVWADLPDRYPPYQTCHRRFQQWVRSGVMSKVLQALAQDLPCANTSDADQNSGHPTATGAIVTRAGRELQL